MTRMLVLERSWPEKTDFLEIETLSAAAVPPIFRLLNADFAEAIFAGGGCSALSE